MIRHISTLTILILAVFSSFYPSTLSAQVTDSVTIQISSPPTSISISAPEGGYVGDTVTIAYEIVDNSGEPTVGIATWEVSPDSLAEIVAQTDSTVTVQLLRRGNATFIVTVRRLDRIVIGGRYNVPSTDSLGNEIPAGTFIWSTQDIFQLEEGVEDAAELCVVGISDNNEPIFASTVHCWQNLPSLTGVQSLPTLLNRMYLPYRRASISLPPIQLRPEYNDMIGS